MFSGQWNLRKTTEGGSFWERLFSFIKKRVKKVKFSFEYFWMLLGEL